MVKSIAFGLALFAALAASNPREEHHARRMVERASQDCGRAGDLGRLMCGGMASLATAGMEYRDHVVFSTARLGSVETLGVLGRVLVVAEGA
ncbi:MAG: hypothetical protein AB1918_17980 [Pseudomonadota bacterium]